MTSDDFINGLKTEVEDGGVKAILSNLKKPAGRSPDPKMVELSEWYLSQSIKDREKIEAIIVESVRTALFGVLCTIDGVKKISDDNGWLELNYVSDTDGQVSSIKSGLFGDLHDIYRATI